jgi:uncharacterized protein YdeI (YjbR/CyaY-like superfamily)
MSTRDPRIDDYIARSAEFARPILAHLREVVHAGCPAVEETRKWGMPHFTYRGGLFASMAAFKEHATFGFWRGSEILGESGRSTDAMGQFGRIAALADLPPDEVLAGYVREAVRLADAGPKARAGARASKPAPEVPADLAAALAANAAAQATFDRFPPSHRREYLTWITEAKREETRAKRVATAVEWIAEGKGRNWKYERC